MRDIEIVHFCLAIRLNFRAAGIQDAFEIFNWIIVVHTNEFVYLKQGNFILMLFFQ